MQVVLDQPSDRLARQKLLGGLLEHVAIHPTKRRELAEELGVNLLGAQLWCRDCGRLEGLPLNPRATKLTKHELVGGIVGPVLVCKL
jgi:hypothetical protein